MSDLVARLIEHTESWPTVYESDRKNREILQEAIAALSWRPIASAPKDGTPVLVFCRASREPIQEEPDEQHVAWFDGKNGKDWWAVSGGYMSVMPTHWVALRDEPSES